MASFTGRALRKLLAPSLVALAVLGFAMAQAAPAMAAPKVSTSVGVGCSIKNGVATLKVTAKATASGGATLDEMTITIGGVQEYNSTTIFNATVTKPAIAPGTYAILIEVDATGASDVTKTGSATITENGCSAKVG